VRAAAAIAAVVGGLALASPAAAQEPPFADCPPYGEQRICTATIPSFDGAPLDVDLTLPMHGSGGGSHPLIVLLHGFGNDKREWQSLTDEGDRADKLRWNSHWFARHGFYVLTHTARGFRTNGEPQEYQPQTPTGSSASLPSGTIQIKSREVEVRDTQYLASLVARTFPDVDRDRVAVSGGSYGGGESWLHAADPEWDDFTPHLRLQVAVAKYPWTDVGYALAPSGHGPDPYETSLGTPDSDTGNGFPIGTAKASYITGLFERGNERGIFEEGTRTTPTTEGPINITAWNGRLVAGGDPYAPEETIVRQARRGLTEYRSAYYQDEQWAAQARGRKAAIFTISGWTDELFEAVESFRMFKYLKRLDPQWPVEVAVADVGHSRAQNPPKTWERLNAQAWQFLRAHINGAHEQQTGVSSEQTHCGDPGEAAQRLTGRTPEDLASGTLTVAFARGGLLTELSGVDDKDNLTTDPIVGGAFAPSRPHDTCRQSDPQRVSTGYTAVSQPLPAPRIYVGLGTLNVPYTLAGLTATVHARIWDVAPSGETLLITRGTYRLDTLADDADAPTGTLRLPLYGNHWQLDGGHRLRVDLQEFDAPTFRPNNSPNTVTFSPPTLVLPTRQAGDMALTGL
jgi:predicted acyl esterase